ncbi:MAG: two-component system, cell cycle sensor histidine kinase and response regulator CckA [Acidobacteriota bacterium]|jgi:PAS domain S-box-containing protein|nr:two-component system, cell cycle sensor histidine kinase and response regulator CckA [Acidobacteriota bacterium]
MELTPDDEADVLITPPDQTSAHVSSNLGQILVVDDEVELKNALVEMLNAQGYVTVGCDSGAEALEALRKQNFDVLLSDLMMPGMDGVTLLRSALEIDQNLVCIIMTGQGTIQTAVDAMKVGAFDYVLKPFRLQALLPVLTRAINMRRLHQENLQLRETVAIYELCQTIAFTLDRQTLLSKLADAALQQSEADELSILLLTIDGSELYVAAVRGENRTRLLNERVPLEQGISSWVARERTPLLLEGQVNDARFKAMWPRADIRSAISVPLQVAGKLVGIINVNNVSSPRPFTLGQMKALTILASTAAAALESTSLYERVRQAEQNYRSIFENAGEGIFQSTLEGRFITVNPSLARILGYDSPEEVIETITDITHQLYVDPVRRTEATWLQKERGVLQGLEFEAYRKDGEKIWLSLNRRAVRDENGVEIYREGSIQDITERKRAEEALRESEERYRVVAETATDVIVTIDENSTILFANGAVERVFGYAVSELLGKQITMLMPEYLRHLHKAGFSRYVETGRKHINWEAVELPGLHKSGQEIPLELSFGQFSKDGKRFFTGIARDITERKRVEQEMRKSEERYRDLVENARDIIYTHDLKGNYTSINKAGEQITGYTREEALGLNLAQTVAPEYLEKARLMVSGKLNGDKETVYDLEIITKDGRKVAVEVNTRLVFQDDVAVGVQGIARDVTERKRAEAMQHRRAAQVALRSNINAALAESNTPLRRILEHCAEAMVQHLDAAFARIWTLNKDENVLELQASAGMYTHIDGPHARVPVGTFKIGLIAEERQPHITNDVQSDPRVSDKEWAEREGMIAFAGYPLTVEDRLVGVVAMFARRRLADDTLDALSSVADLISQGIERKRAEEELLQSEQRYRLLFELNPQPMWVFDLETLSFLEINEAAIHHYGYSREEFLTMTIKDIRPPEDVPNLLANISSITPEHEEAGIWKHSKKDGTLIDVEITAHELTFYGRPAQIVLAYDVTERKVLEEQLRQSQKLEAVGQLAGGVAHDFNNLLTVITGYSDLSLRRLDKDDPLRSNLEQIKKAGERAASLTRQLLAFSRKQVLQPKVLQLNAVVADVDKMLRRLIGEDIDVLTVLEPGLGQIKADPGQIEQVLLNLAVNARDAMPQGGKLTIETANVYLDNQYVRRHTAIQPGNYVMLAVSDTGCGIDVETQARMFEPFFTTKEQGKGTGLGLSTVYGIVKQSGGHLWVYSEVGKGTTFKIYLPRIDGVTEGDAAPNTPAELPRGQETVLLTEDEEQVRQMIRMILEMSGYRVLEAADGEEALAIYKQYEGEIDLIMTDVVMPLMSGRELVQSLEILHPGIKVLYMSGYTDDAIVRHGLLDQEIVFLQKPFTPDVLLRKVRKVLDAPHEG